MAFTRDPKNMSREELIAELLELRQSAGAQPDSVSVYQSLTGFHSELLDALPSPIYVKGRDERYITCNESFTEFMGMSKEEIIGKTAFDIAPEHLAKSYKSNDRHLFAHGGTSVFQSQLPHKKTEIHDVLFHKTVFHDVRGDIAGIIGIFYDITEELAVKNKLEAERGRFEQLFDNLQNGVLIISRESEAAVLKVAAINGSLLRLDQLKRADVVHADLYETFSYLDTEQFHSVFSKVMESGESEMLPWYFCENESISGWRDLYLFRLSDTEMVVSCRDVTGRYQAMQNIKESEERFALAVKGSHDGIWDWKLSSDTVYVSPQWKEILGYSDSEVPGDILEWRDRIHPDDAPVVYAEFMDVVHGKKDSLALEYRMINTSGEYIWVLTKGASVKDEAGKVVRITGSMSDLTERKQLEEALRRKEAFYRNIFNNADVGIFRTSIGDGLVLEANQRMANMLGYDTPSEMVNSISSEQSIWRRGDDRSKRIASGIDDAGRFNAAEVEVVTKDGLVRWHRYSGRVLKDMGYIEGVAIDITEEKLLTENLGRQTELLTNVLITVPHFIFWKNLQGVYKGANDVYAQRLGLRSHKELLGKTDYDVLPKEIAEYFADLDKNIIASGQPLINHEETTVLPNGNTSTVLTSKVPLRDSQGNIIGILGIFTDITDRKRMEQELREREEMFRIIGEGAQDGIVMLNEEGRINFWNEGARKIFGYSSDEALGRSVDELIVPEDVRGTHAEKYAVFSKTGNGPVLNNTVEQFALHKNGHTFPVELSVSSVQRDNQWHAIGIIRDITERYKTVQELQYTSYHDALTELYNRAYFDMKGQELDEPFGVVVCDVDGLKLINDNLGHDVGDELLKATADVLKNCFRERDIIARIGGDEFAVLLTKIATPAVCMVEQRLVQAIAVYTQKENALPLHISIGCSLQMNPEAGLESAFQEADEKMYAYKKERKARVQALIKEYIASKKS